MRPLTLLRTTEHASIAVDLPIEQRRAIVETARLWQIAGGLRSLPLSFGGVEGADLTTVQYAGVVAAGGACIEIFPKLDREVIDAKHVDDGAAAVVMRQLLWMMHASGHLDLVQAGAASLAEQPMRFFDLFAWLLGENLLRELTVGVGHHYVARAEDLRAVRGRIDFSRQLTRNWDRLDRIACRWDEFSADTALNRVLKAACRFLAAQTQHAEASRLLASCLGMLDDVSDLRAGEALAGAHAMPWPRGAERFRGVFEFARQMLRGIGQETLAGDAQTFAWLIDMNVLFEEFVAAAIAARFGVAVRKQHCVGTLFRIESGGIEQNADTFWHDTGGALWIGDAKYKRIDAAKPLNQILDPADVRQLTTYGRMAKSVAARRCVALFYPCVGDSPPVRTARTWNDLEFFLVPVSLRETDDLAAVLPPIELSPPA
jgi:5-methylcytosine-specific restriction enzyme subunit McrC